MFFQKPKIEILAAHPSDFALIHGNNLMFLLRDGKAHLKSVWYTVKTDEPPYEMNYSALELNGTPLLHIQSSGCPTCESLLAAGYGMPEDCAEMRQAAKNLSLPFTTLEDALERLAPIFGLLLTGVYMLSVSDYYPTDGDGHFFWNAPNAYTTVPATAELYDSVNYRCLPSYPCFLYPTQPTAKHDASRVEYYRAKLRAGERIAPALAYSVGGSMSALLDGHHRAAACALEGVKLPCLTISPANYSLNAGGKIHAIYWSVGGTAEMPTLTDSQQKALKSSVRGERVWRDVAPKTGMIFNEPSLSAYQEAVKQFPTCHEAAALALYPYEKITTDGIHDFANDTENNETNTVISLLAYLSRQKDVDLKALALPFTARGYHPALRREAFRILSTVKNDSEIEDFFVDYLVNYNDRADPLWGIANDYWDIP